MKYLLVLFLLAGCQDTGTVYGCSEENLPPEIQAKCNKLLKKKTPRMENGCVVQELQGREVKTCG
jgi:hypothetical protein